MKCTVKCEMAFPPAELAKEAGCSHTLQHTSNSFPRPPTPLPVCMHLARPGSLDTQSLSTGLGFVFTGSVAFPFV